MHYSVSQPLNGLLWNWQKLLGESDPNSWTCLPKPQSLLHSSPYVVSSLIVSSTFLILSFSHRPQWEGSELLSLLLEQKCLLSFVT